VFAVVLQVELWSYRGDEGATISRGAMRTLYGWRSWIYPAVTHRVNGLLSVVTLKPEVTASTETVYDIRIELSAGVCVCVCVCVCVLVCT
jgi:hypothetical protein